MRVSGVYLLSLMRRPDSRSHKLLRQHRTPASRFECRTRLSQEAVTGRTTTRRRAMGRHSERHRVKDYARVDTLVSIG